MATIEEFLLAAEYILNQGNDKVILCERGIRTFETSTRNTLDLSAVPMLKRLSHLPVIVDPSHGTGLRWMVPAMAKAAVAVGADGLIIEVHYKPAEAICDGYQSLNLNEFSQLMTDLKKISIAVGKDIFVAETFLRLEATVNISINIFLVSVPARLFIPAGDPAVKLGFHKN